MKRIVDPMRDILQHNWIGATSDMPQEPSFC